LLVFARVILLATYVGSFLLLIQSVVLASVLLTGLAIILLAVSPLVLAYGIVVPLWLGYKIIQAPKQRQMVEAARQAFLNHPALKIAVAGSYAQNNCQRSFTNGARGR